MLKAQDKSTGVIFNIVGFFMTSNNFEFFVTEKPDEDGIGWAIVAGNVTEYGTYSATEVSPYITVEAWDDEISDDEESDSYIAPPPGYKWVK